jgi:7-carboxy-7-deazaguanine synthase
MRISEIFYSLQGEGFLAGTPSIFVRLAGCPLRCRWCDTKYALETEAGVHYSIETIIKNIQQWSSCKYVVITGGEPMLDEQLPQLAKELKKLGKHITIETAGIIFIPDLPCDLMSISPKLTNSIPDTPQLAARHENLRLDTAVLGELIDNYKYQLKFVVDSKNDLQEIAELLDEIGRPAPENIILMPQAKTTEQLLAKSPVVADMCKKTGYTFGQRLQVLLWDNKRAT